MENPVFVIIACSLIIFAAFFIRALTGFGSALVSIPLLALLLDLKFAVPLEALLEIGLSILLLRKVYRSIDKRILIPLIIGTVFGSVAGTYVLYSFANLFLKKALGAAIILFALHLLRGKAGKDGGPLASGWGLLAGAVGGVFGGMFGTSGPAFVVYLAHTLKRKDVLRASLIGLFAVDYSWRAGIYAAAGLLTLETVEFALLMIPALVLGTLLGHNVQFQIGERRFMQVVAGLLFVSGILLLVR